MIKISRLLLFLVGFSALQESSGDLRGLQKRSLQSDIDWDFGRHEPPVPVICSPGQTRFVASILAGANPSGISWELTDICTGTTWSGGNYEVLFGQETEQICLEDADKRYAFIIDDPNNDALGSYGIYFGGGLIHSRGTQDDSPLPEVTFFGDPNACPTPNPTEISTPQPTPIPTRPPSPRPTFEPTTPNPTKRPTRPPTPTPTKRPTRPPTPNPTTRRPTPEPTPDPSPDPTPEPTTSRPTSDNPTSAAPTGSTSTPGPTGTTSTPGPTGSTATPGPTSNTATPGPTGSTATPGPTGATSTPGPTGSASTPGPTGSTPGPTGSTSTPGPTGSTATPGPTGSTSTPGPTGSTPVPSSVTPGPTGSTSTPGPTGSTATPGPTGSTATPGPTGSTATPGPTGSTATPGPTGATSTPGPTGSVSTPGPTGSTATPGPTGSTSTPGPTGSTPVPSSVTPGPTGSTSTPGPTGSTATPVPTGSTSTPGPTGSTPVPSSVTPGPTGSTPMPSVSTPGPTSATPSPTAVFSFERSFTGGFPTQAQALADNGLTNIATLITGDLAQYTVITDNPQVALTDCTDAPTVVDDTYVCAVWGGVFTSTRTIGFAGPYQIRLPPTDPIDTFTTAIGQINMNPLWDPETNDGISNEDWTRTFEHEVLHIMGIGTLWPFSFFNLVNNPNTTSCEYRADTIAAREFQNISGCPSGTAIPMETQNSTCGHWNDECFGGRERMVPSIQLGSLNPSVISRVTLGSLEDMGYTVNYDAAGVLTNEQFSPECMCSAVVGDSTNNFVAKPPLSSEGRAAAVADGLAHLAREKEKYEALVAGDSASALGSGVWSLGHQVTTVFYKEGDHIYDVIVWAKDAKGPDNVVNKESENESGYTSWTSFSINILDFLSGRGGK